MVSDVAMPPSQRWRCTGASRAPCTPVEPLTLQARLAAGRLECHAALSPEIIYKPWNASAPQVKDVLLLRHRDTGNPKSAFVEFESAEEVGLAVERSGMVRRQPSIF